ncbi:MAG TPA: outer membrane beta-barrel protein [Pirellulaceae bacterium]|nr:outer membrane beta-barrel protein [Pirellulaceae bacterium]
MTTNLKICVAGITSLILAAAAHGQSSYDNPQGAGKVYPWRIQDTETSPVPAAPASNPGNVSFRLLDSLARQDESTAQVGDDVPVAPPTGQATGQVPLTVRSNAIYENGNYFGPECHWCQLGDVRRLFGTGPGGTRVGGFVQSGWHTRDIVPFNNRQDELNLHQFWAYVDRPANRSCGWGVGYRFDIVYGIDAQDIQAIGNRPNGAPTGWDNSMDHGRYGWAIPQAYVSFANWNTEVRAGYFLSPFGFEQVPATENFFYSRTYSRYFSHPFTHTGVIAQREVTDNLTTIGGFTLGWDSAFERTDGGFNFLGGVRYQAGPYVRLGLNSSIGDTGYRGSGTVQNAFAQLKLTDRAHYVVEGTVVNLQGNDELGFANYLFYCVNPCVALGTRFEWWKGDRQTGTSNSTYDWTIGANIRPHANFVIRPEVRVDWGALAFTPGDLIYGIDAIILY